MKIAFIGQKGIPAAAGGVEKHVENLATRLAEMGHEVFVYVRNNYTEKTLNEYRGVKLVHLPSISTKNLDTISYTFLATFHSLFQKYDIIHYQAIGPASLSFIPKMLKPKTTIISTFHCQDYFHQKWGWFARKYLKFGEWMTCKIPDKTIAVSKTLRSYALNKYCAKTSYIPNGANVTYNSSTKALDRWNLKDKKYIVSVGRLIKHKGNQYLIEAFKKLEDTNRLPNNFKLVIVGNGFHTEKYVRDLHKISENRKSIIFTNSQTGATLEQLFSHAYLFVQPSESEGLSISLLEAMGYGIAPLVSDIPENIEAIGKCGFSFHTRSKENLEEKLAYLLNKSKEVEKIGKLAKDKVQKEYNWDSIAKKTLKIYESNQKLQSKLTFRKIQAENKLYV